MAGSIKGITIEFRGDTTKLGKALREIDGDTAKLDKNLNKVNKALKFNPTNVELWQQKQTLLSQKVDETKKRLEALKTAQAQMDASGVDKTSNEYMELQREIIETESKLKTFNGQLKEVGSPKLKATAAQFDALGTSLTNAGQAMAGFSAAGAAVVAGLGAMAVKAGQTADDLNTMSKVYGISTAELQKYSAMADLVDVSVETIAASHSKLTRNMASARDGTAETAEAFETLGVNILDSNGELRNADEVWNEVITALGNVGNETERDALAMQLMGKSAMELNPLIQDNGETYKALSDTMAKYGLDFIDQETLDKANEFNDKLDTMKAIGQTTFMTLGAQLAEKLAPALEKVVEWVGKLAGWLSSLSPEVLVTIAAIAGVIAVVAPLLIALGKLSFAISSIMTLASTLGPILAGVSAPILPIIAAIAALIAVGVLLYKNWDTIKAKAIELFNNLKKTFQNIKEKVVTIVQTMRQAIADKIDALKSKVQSVFNTIKEKIIIPIQNAKQRAVDAIQNLRTSISSRIEAIRSKVSSVFQSIKEKITSPIEKAKEIVKGAIDKIKGFFPFNLGKILNLKLPHISVSGGEAPFGIMGKGKLPSFSVEWYKTGGIFNKPNIIGVGEAGSEAVVPLDKFWNKLDRLNGGNTINMNITVNGTDSPEEWAHKLVKQMKLEMRSM